MPVSPSFCSTWNQPDEVIGRTGAPVENAVETADPTPWHSKASSQPSLYLRLFSSRKVLKIKLLILVRSRLTVPILTSLVVYARKHICTVLQHFP